MQNQSNENVQPNDEMMRKILRHECGNDCDEFAADELEVLAHRKKHNHKDEFAEDGEIGESDYFSTCEYTMIPSDDDSINCQGS